MTLGRTNYESLLTQTYYTSKEKNSIPSQIKYSFSCRIKNISYYFINSFKSYIGLS